jgi:hypothetical protein
MAEILEFDKMFYTNFEPKMKNRYVMEIDGIPSYMVKAAARPSITFEPVVLDHINIKRKLQGKGEWQDITVTLYKKDIDFYMLGPVGDKIEQWKLKGAFIISANFGDVAFDSNEPATIELSLAYDYAILEF